MIVSVARTPIGRAYRGALNNLEGPTLGGHAIRAAVAAAGIDGAEVDDVIMGCAMPQGTTGYNIGRLAALAAGLRVEVSGMTMDRQCSSGLMAVATAAKLHRCQRAGSPSQPAEIGVAADEPPAPVSEDLGSD